MALQFGVPDSRSEHLTSLALVVRLVALALWSLQAACYSTFSCYGVVHLGSLGHILLHLTSLALEANLSVLSMMVAMGGLPSTFACYGWSMLVNVHMRNMVCVWRSRLMCYNMICLRLILSMGLVGVGSQASMEMS